MTADRWVLLILCLALFIEGLHSFIDNWCSALAMTLAALAAVVLAVGALT